MNLTLLPTDLKPTNKGSDKSLSRLDRAVDGNPASQFGQLLDAETAAMRKPSAQAGKNSLQGGTPTTADKTAGNHSPLTTTSNHTVVEDKPQATTTPQKNPKTRAELTVLKEENPLSAEALSAAIPIQLAGLLAPLTNPTDVSETADELTGNESSEDGLLDDGLLITGLAANVLAENRLSANTLQKGHHSAVNAMPAQRITDSQLIDTEQQDDALQLAARQETSLNNAFLNNKTASVANRQSGQTPLTEPVKLATTSNSKTVSINALLKPAIPVSQEPELFQIAVQAALALNATESASIDSPTLLATPTPLSAGHHPTGQFQLTNPSAPLLNAHLGSEEWQQQLNQHVLFFNRHGLQQAELRLHPQELGALHIRMSVEDNQAQLHFVSAHQHVRVALEAALPGLRHALAENGIQLAQSSIHSDNPGNDQSAFSANHQANHSDGQSGAHAERQNHRLATVTEATPSPVSAPQRLASTRGGIDTFA
ncbi:Flagellar hook-length control protein FliK [Xenorhabdus poinarii G6]|uniref:Flagellar hook-length control protein FliK n=1 Tax=Xenorhabdus poinarii G6 TaxID=1354304 RepID=A0A068R3E8_9GAMM|nr:flagellar hook-length control protein FliK [Xenorhabdus poinarii]CDG21703.1 Flagellar hook-length control protein FliK [Xenorhabdus poinarii G6]